MIFVNETLRWKCSLIEVFFFMNSLLAIFFTASVYVTVSIIHPTLQLYCNCVTEPADLHQFVCAALSVLSLRSTMLI